MRGLLSLFCAVCAAFMLFVAPATAASLLETPGVQRIQAQTAAFGPVPVWTYKPARVGADAPVVIVLHGVMRDADRYLSEWIPIAEKAGLVVVAPEFTKETFPGTDGYILGWVRSHDGTDRPKSLWSFGVIEAAFDAVRAELGLTAPSYAFYGHSAGAQFAHRFLTYGGGPRMSRAVVANAGWYTFPNTAADFPFGLRGAPAGSDLDAALAAPVTILLGDADIDPNHHSLNREPGAMAQGSYRFARGLAYFAAARAEASRRGLAFGWTCSVAPGIAHDNAGMAALAVPFLLTGSPGQGAAECPL